MAGAMAPPPIVGGWFVHDVEDTAAPPVRLTCLAAGLLLQVAPAAGEHVSLWRPPPPQPFALALQHVVPDGVAAIRGDGAAADGQRVTVADPIEVAPGGAAGTGQYGPGRITGTRPTIEPMGPPVGPLPVRTAQLGSKPAASSAG